MPRLTAAQWLAARQAWEADPAASFESIGRRFGVSGVAVRKRRCKQGWTRLGALRQINERAHIAADTRAPGPAAEAATDGAAPAARRGVSRRAGTEPAAVSVAASVELRARLVNAHRAEWREHTGLYPLESIRGDYELGKTAKISAEMLALRQRGERAAWGLDDEAESAEVVIRRTYA